MRIRSRYAIDGRSRLTYARFNSANRQRSKTFRRPNDKSWNRRRKNDRSDSMAQDRTRGWNRRIGSDRNGLVLFAGAILPVLFMGISVLVWDRARVPSAPHALPS